MQNGNPSHFQNIVALCFLGIIVACSICFASAKPLHRDNGLLQESNKFRFLNTPTYEHIYVRKTNKTEDLFGTNGTILSDNKTMYFFSALGRKFSLMAERNPSLIGPGLELRFHGDGPSAKEIPIPSQMADCHFLVDDGNVTMAISDCNNGGIHAFLIYDGKVYEIRPLNYNQSQLGMEGEEKESFDENLHIIRPVDPSQLSIFTEATLLPEIAKESRRAKRESAVGQTHKIIELAIFVDYNTTFASFIPYIGKEYGGGPNYMNFLDVLLALVNGVQALFHHSSLGQRIDISLVKVEINRIFSSKANVTSQLLDDFAHYQASLNPLTDENPRHWDLAAYLYDRTFVDFLTLGKAYHGEICHPWKNSLVAKFGARKESDIWGKHYSGFGAIVTLAHEIGHTLGIGVDVNQEGDSYKNVFVRHNQNFERYGPMRWSSQSRLQLADFTDDSCLRDSSNHTFAKLLHTKYEDKPGQWWSADDQCDVFFGDRRAQPKFQNTFKICSDLECTLGSIKRHAGPALPGTTCGEGMWCDGGECVPTNIKNLITGDSYEWR